MTDSKTKEPWTIPEDLLERKQEADFLENYLKQASNTPASSHGRGSFVINLKGQWGTGKTYFLGNLAQQLRNSNHKVVEFDAWRADPDVDPLISLIAAIKKEIKPDLKRGSQIGELYGKVSKSAGTFAAAIGKGLVKQGAKWAIGEAAEEIEQLLEEAEFFGLDKDDVTKALEATEKETKSSIATTKLEIASAANFAREVKSANTKQEAIKAFSESFEKIAQAYADREGCEGPFYIFVDELDRCRPTFAIEVLERINHLFDVKGVVFVIGTDSDELEHSIKAVYGSEFGSRSYLNRFFSFTYNLYEPDKLELINFIAKKYDLKLDKFATLNGINTEQKKLELIHQVLAPYISNVRDYFQIFFMVKTAQMCWPEEVEIDLIFIFFCAMLVFNKNESFLDRIQHGRDAQTDDYKIKSDKIIISHQRPNINLTSYIQSIIPITRKTFLEAFDLKDTSNSQIDNYFKNMLRSEVSGATENQLKDYKSAYSRYVDILKSASKLTIFKSDLD